MGHFRHKIATLTDYKKSVDVYCGVRAGFHFLEYCQSRLVVRPELQDVTEVKSCFLEMAVCLQYLTKLKGNITDIDWIYSSSLQQT